MNRVHQVVGATAACLFTALGEAGPRRQATLEGRAVLAANTFATGRPSGAQLGAGPINGVSVPFDRQPVQGISALNATGIPGEFWAMPDNGYGRKDNSADFNLRVYRIRPNFETDHGGSGAIAVLGWIELSDPDGHVSFTIVNDGSAGRVLTGSDFDIESMRVDHHGDFWFGDEFGPFILHTDAQGRVLEAPFTLAGVVSPASPFLAGTATVPNSRGFEGMALSADGKRLHPMLEGALVADTERQRRLVYEFDIPSRSFTGTVRQYRTEAANYSVAELVALDAHRFLAIERDGLQGVAAAFKKVFVVDFREVDAAGYLSKQEIVDLLDIDDPAGLSLPARPGDVGLGQPFRFPYETIEALLPLDGVRVLVMNDNNYPFSAGRNPALPDDNEAIVLRVGSLKTP
jgi:hypothetical protein